MNTIDLIVNQLNKQELEKKIDLILKDILLFEQINYEMIRKKRPASNEITANNLAEQLDETLSAKRRRKDDDDGYVLTPVKDNQSYSKEKIYFQVKNNMIEINEFCFCLFDQVIYRTWQDRRKLKRGIETTHPNISHFEREKLISLKLQEEQDHRLETPIYLSMEIKLLPTMEKKKAQIRFELQTNEQHQLFADLTHFLNLYLPKMLDIHSMN